MHNPDKWLIVRIPNGGAKVLGSWSGGYLSRDSWRLSSGLKKVEEDGDYYLMHNHSGSIYRCHKEMEGTNMIARGVLNQMKAMSDEVKEITIEEFNQMKRDQNEND